MFAHPFSRPFSGVLLGVLAMLPAASPAADGEAKALLDRIGTARGLCVVLGDPQGALTLDLARQSELTLFVQAAKSDEVEAIRKAADAVGLLGTRIWVQQGDLARLNLANDLADAVIVGKPALATPPKELLRVLRPAGTILLDGNKLTKPLPAGADEWTHPYHGPDNNPQSNDQLARRPYLTHFMAEPWYCPLSQMTVISNGRMFKVFGDRSSAKPQEPLLNVLLAMNAFNGTTLWKRELAAGFMIHRSTFIATPETLFLADNESCKLLDPTTGKVRAEITAPPDLTDGPVWKWMALDGGILYALVGDKELPDEALRGDRLRGAGWPWWKINKYTFGFGRTLLAIDPATRKVLWHHREQEMIDSRAIGLKNGRLYFYSDRKFLACLDAKTGKVVWKNIDAELLDAIGAHGPAQHPMLGFASTCYMKVGDDALYFAGPQRPRLLAASTKDGKLLWQHAGGNVQLVLRPDALYALGEGRINQAQSSLKLDPLTGKVLATFASRDRCTRATGCLDSIFTRGGAGGSTAVFDVTAKEPRIGMVSPMRPACTDGVVVAHGYLYWGPWMCRCDQTQLGVISLGPAGSFDYTAAATDAERLESLKGEGVKPFPMNASDWPVYRRDNARSVTTSHTTPAKIARRWEYTPPSKVIPTAPVTASGLVLVSGADGAVRALDAETGKPRWTAYTGGPLKYPPALANDRVYVGSGDGWVYCLEAASGRLLWRFRAAPVERTIPLYGTLSSTWPLGGGVLVDNGVVYGAAGISNFDGTHIFALDAVSGKIRWENHTSGHSGNELPEGGVSVQGPPLLHGGAVYLAAGNKPTVASYAVADGKFTPAGTGRGKDLFIRKGEVQATGFPLYWRPEDDHFLSPMELETPTGVLAITTSSVARLAADPAPKPAAVWTSKPFQEIAAVAVTKNAVLVTGLDRDVKKPEKIEAALCAVSLADGTTLWKQPLPTVPTAWGLAVDRAGRIVVTLLDGRVLCFAGE